MQRSCSCNELTVLHRQRGSAKHPAFQGERELARAIVLAKEARERREGFTEIGGEKTAANMGGGRGGAELLLMPRWGL